MADIFIKIVGELEAKCTPLLAGLESKIFSGKSLAKTVSEAIPISKHSEALPLMNLFHVLVIISGYLVAVRLGMFIMERRKEKFTLKTYSLIHNFLMQVP